MTSVFRSTIYVFALLCYFFIFTPTASSQNNRLSPSTPPRELALSKAVMCERIEGYVPVNGGIIFSSSLEKISCFSYFDPVPEESFIYHSWFFRDKLSTRIKLSLKPPRWSTFSSIQLREADKGPWRVEITDDKGRVLHVLRFSITD